MNNRPGEQTPKTDNISRMWGINVAAQKTTAESIQSRVNAILSTYHERERVFASRLQVYTVTPEEVEELEYHLARAEVELREVQRRVDSLRAELESKRDHLAPDS